MCHTISATLPEGMLYARYSRTRRGFAQHLHRLNITREFPVRDAARVMDKNIGVVENGVISGVAFLDLNYNGRLDEGRARLCRGGGGGPAAGRLSGNPRAKTETGREDAAFRLEGRAAAATTSCAPFCRTTAPSP